MDCTDPPAEPEEGGLVIKLKPGEAITLATLMANVARPRNAQEAAQVEAWIKRLQGGRS